MDGPTYQSQKISNLAKISFHLSSDPAQPAHVSKMLSCAHPYLHVK